MSRIDIKLEDPGDSEEIEVLELHVSPGDEVSEGDPVIEVATDKANVEIPAPASGSVAEVLVAVGDTVPVATVLVVLSS